MKKLVNFGLCDGQHGVLTEGELLELCKSSETKISNKSVASFDDAQEWVCMGGVIEKGLYIVADGILSVDGEYDELELISNLKIVC